MELNDEKKNKLEKTESNMDLEPNIESKTETEPEPIMESKPENSESKIIDNELNRDENGIPQPFTLFWKGKKLEDSNVKLRKIVVEGEKLPLYRADVKNPIVVILNKDIGDPVWFEAHDIDWRDPNTPR